MGEEFEYWEALSFFCELAMGYALNALRWKKYNSGISSKYNFFFLEIFLAVSILL